MRSRPCVWCGAELPVLAHSRARFCSSRCRTAAHRAGVPGELRRRPRWVRWTGRKRPQTVDGRIASSTDPETWATYQAARRSTAGVGLGFVLNGDGIVCLDLDGCLVDGVPNAAARQLLELAGRTYVEVSPSGRGLHVWGRGALAAGRCTMFRGQPVELYGSGRYITVTGVRFPGAASTLGDLSPALAAVLASSSCA